MGNCVAIVRALWSPEGLFALRQFAKLALLLGCMSCFGFFLYPIFAGLVTHQLQLAAAAPPVAPLSSIFTADNMTDVFVAGESWVGFFSPATGPIPFSLSVDSCSGQLRSGQTFRATLANQFLNLSVNGHFKARQQGYLSLTLVRVNWQSVEDMELRSWRADGYISGVNASVVTFTGTMQPANIFGQFQLHNNESLKLPAAINASDWLSHQTSDDDGEMTRRSELLGVFIGMLIPIVLVLLAVLSVFVSNCRNLCCSSESSINFKKFHNSASSQKVDCVSAASSAYDVQSYITNSTSVGVLTRSATILEDDESADATTTAAAAMTHVPPPSSRITTSRSMSLNQIELHHIPRMDTNERLATLMTSSSRDGIVSHEA